MNQPQAYVRPLPLEPPSHTADSHQLSILHMVVCVCLLLSLRLTMMPATESSCVPGAASVPRACSHPRRRAVTPHACEGADAERLSLPHQAGLQGQC